MIVIDTSSMIELLTSSDELGEGVRAAVAGEKLIAPHFIDLEFSSVLRGLVLGRKLDQAKANLALESLMQSDIDRYEHAWYLPRIWELRANMTTYDASYVALAEAFQVPLLTVDCKFERTPGPKCNIVTIKCLDGQRG
ncbi:type II toxin-antitoxin system VapC family toxin [Glycomyces paridis]|uniref:Type II toxin-antitoxin system VapC family toxin n=1 Tax=Glycomyces paridis TaxID=2126555 RepID=A0A4S8PM48_9ACTN|nr:type II toxin-antitoxin system VapC family toxin [Glycomyces paridis]THV31928.1 type II toxin-antitoxin system VapC family toxin [Glycomyces paridis]